LPILHRVYELYKLFYQHLELFPKKDKYTLGKKINDLILEIIELIFLAVNSRLLEKISVLQKISLKIDLLKILIRLAKDIKSLDNKKYIHLQEQLQEIGKMVGGWMKSLNN